MDRIKFHFLHTNFNLSSRTRLKEFILKIFREEGFTVQAINYVFCSDKYLLGLNKAYLHHNTYTDIITFGLSTDSEPIMADVYISVERVRENARIFQSNFLQELYRVLFHGSLHLCGYKDKTKNETRQMRTKEDYYLKLYFVSRETKTQKS